MAWFSEAQVEKEHGQAYNQPKRGLGDAAGIRNNNGTITTPGDTERFSSRDFSPLDDENGPPIRFLTEWFLVKEPHHPTKPPSTSAGRTLSPEESAVSSAVCEVSWGVSKLCVGSPCASGVATAGSGGTVGGKGSGYAQKRFLTPSGVFRMRHPLPEDKTFAVDSEEYILYGHLEPMSTAEYNNENPPIPVRLERLCKWSIDRSIERRGIWVRSSKAWYRLKKPSQEGPKAKVSLKPLAYIKDMKEDEAKPDSASPTKPSSEDSYKGDDVDTDETETSDEDTMVSVSSSYQAAYGETKSRRMSVPKLHAVLTSQEEVHLELRAKFGLLSNILDLVSESTPASLYPSLNCIGENDGPANPSMEVNGYLPVLARRSPENIHKLLSPNEEDWRKYNTPSEPLNRAPFDLGLLRHCPDFVMDHLSNFHGLLHRNCAFMTRLGDMVTARQAQKLRCRNPRPKPLGRLSGETPTLTSTTQAPCSAGFQRNNASSQLSSRDLHKDDQHRVSQAIIELQSSDEDVADADNFSFSDTEEDWTSEQYLESAQEAERRGCRTPWGDRSEGHERIHPNHLFDIFIHRVACKKEARQRGTGPKSLDGFHDLPPEGPSPNPTSIATESTEDDTQSEKPTTTAKDIETDASHEPQLSSDDVPSGKDRPSAHSSGDAQTKASIGKSVHSETAAEREPIARSSEVGVAPQDGRGKSFSIAPTGEQPIDNDLNTASSKIVSVPHDGLEGSSAKTGEKQPSSFQRASPSSIKVASPNGAEQTGSQGSGLKPGMKSSTVATVSPDVARGASSESSGTAIASQGEAEICSTDMACSGSSPDCSKLTFSEALSSETTGSESKMRPILDDVSKVDLEAGNAGDLTVNPSLKNSKVTLASPNEAVVPHECTDVHQPQDGHEAVDQTGAGVTAAGYGCVEVKKGSNEWLEDAHSRSRNEGCNDEGRNDQTSSTSSLSSLVRGSLELPVTTKKSSDAISVDGRKRHSVADEATTWGAPDGVTPAPDCQGLALTVTAARLSATEIDTRRATILPGGNQDDVRHFLQPGLSFPDLDNKDWLVPVVKKDGLCKQFESNQKCDMGLKCPKAHVYRPKSPPRRKKHDDASLVFAYSKCMKHHLADKDFYYKQVSVSEGQVWYTAAFLCPVTGTIYHAAGGEYGHQSQQNLFWYRNTKQALEAVTGLVVDALYCQGLIRTEAHKDELGDGVFQLLVGSADSQSEVRKEPALQSESSANQCEMRPAHLIIGHDLPVAPKAVNGSTSVSATETEVDEARKVAAALGLRPNEPRAVSEDRDDRSCDAIIDVNDVVLPKHQNSVGAAIQEIECLIVDDSSVTRTSRISQNSKKRTGEEADQLSPGARKRRSPRPSQGSLVDDEELVGSLGFVACATKKKEKVIEEDVTIPLTGTRFQNAGLDTCEAHQEVRHEEKCLAVDVAKPDTPSDKDLGIGRTKPPVRINLFKVKSRVQPTSAISVSTVFWGDDDQKTDSSEISLFEVLGRCRIPNFRWVKTCGGAGIVASGRKSLKDLRDLSIGYDHHLGRVYFEAFTLGKANVRVGDYFLDEPAGVVHRVIGLFQATKSFLGNWNGRKAVLKRHRGHERHEIQKRGHPYAIVVPLAWEDKKKKRSKAEKRKRGSTEGECEVILRADNPGSTHQHVLITPMWLGDPDLYLENGMVRCSIRGPDTNETQTETIIDAASEPVKRVVCTKSSLHKKTVRGVKGGTTVQNLDSRQFSLLTADPMVLLRDFVEKKWHPLLEAEHVHMVKEDRETEEDVLGVSLIRAESSDDSDGFAEEEEKKKKRRVSSRKSAKS